MPNTREKLEVIAHIGDHITYKEGIGICYDSALAKVIEDAYMTLKNGVTVNEWISVKDRLPENDAYINVTTDGVVIPAYWHNDRFYAFTAIGVATVGGVTHWMPMPQPPKGEWL